MWWCVSIYTAHPASWVVAHGLSFTHCCTINWPHDVLGPLPSHTHTHTHTHTHIDPHTQTRTYTHTHTRPPPQPTHPCMHPHTHMYRAPATLPVGGRVHVATSASVVAVPTTAAHGALRANALYLIHPPSNPSTKREGKGIILPCTHMCRASILTHASPFKSQQQQSKDGSSTTPLPPPLPPLLGGGGQQTRSNLTTGVNSGITLSGIAGVGWGDKASHEQQQPVRRSGWGWGPLTDRQCGFCLAKA